MTADFRLEDLRDRPAWQDDALCPEVDIEAFFPEKGGSTNDAKEICSLCPVRAECLAAGLYEQYGIWGGVTERARRKLRPGYVPGRGRQMSDPAALDRAMVLIAGGMSLSKTADIVKVSRATLSKVWRERHQEAA